MGWIVIISGGPGGPQYITEMAKLRARRCETLVGSKKQLQIIEPSPDQEVYEETGIERIMDLLDRNRERETGVVVTGDAGIYSLSQKIIERFGKKAVKEIVPGVSSLQVAFARIREPWLNVRVFSYHGRALEGIEDVLRHERVAILCDSEHNSKVILGKLMDYGLFVQKRDIYVCQELTFPDEKVIKISSPEEVDRIEVKRREIIVILDSRFWISDL